MRQENESQIELPGLPAGGPVEQVREMSEVAALQSQVLDLGLVRESRPVFVYDAKLAKAKSGNAERQARFREKLAEKGLVKSDVPAEILASVKEKGGWEAWISEQKAVKIQEKIVEIKVEVVKEVPGPTVFVEKIVEKIVEKQNLKLNSEQKKSLLLGQKVASLTGLRAKFVRFLLEI